MLLVGRGIFLSQIKKKTEKQLTFSKKYTDASIDCVLLPDIWGLSHATLEDLEK
jgi:hypothetical protein